MSDSCELEQASHEGDPPRYPRNDLPAALCEARVTPMELEEPAMNTMRSFHRTNHGEIVLGDSLTALTAMEDSSVDLIMTSPPFALLRKKDYGNQPAESYLDWFRPFAEQFHRVLRDTGSFVIDIGGSWIPGIPTRSLYHFKLLIMLCDQFGFHLAQESYSLILSPFSMLL